MSLNAHIDKNTLALIVAAGAGERMGGDVPKQYRLLNGQSMLQRSIAAFLHHPAIAEVRVVIHPQHLALYEEQCGNLGLGKVILGGMTRQESVFLGLQALQDSPPHLVLIHDAARPFVSATIIDRVLSVLADAPAVIPAIEIVDTLKQVDGSRVISTPDRASLRAVQTPQGFHYSALHHAHERYKHQTVTDDATLMEKMGVPVAIVQGDVHNRKLTTPHDWQWATMQETGMKQNITNTNEMTNATGIAATVITATGQGVDVHQFVPHPDGTPEAQRIVRLGGICLPHTHRLEGHSDADAVLHALTDAILGAAGAGDIGQHFPPSDAKWKGADSVLFLQESLKLLQREQGMLQHVDVTILCEAPKIGPHRAAMRTRLAELLGLPEKRVNVKATTTEGLGFTGRREGLMAMAIASVRFS